MAEEILYDIKFTGLDSANQGLEKLTQLQIAQQEAIKNTNRAIKEYEKELDNLQQTMADNQNATEEQIALEKDLKQKINDSKVSLAGQKDELQNTNKVRREASKAVSDYNKVIDSEIGSNEQLRGELAILTKEYDKMGKAQRDGSEEGQELTQRIKAISDELKKNESAIGDNRRNVGNYQQAIEGALSKVEIYGVNLGELTNKIKEGIEFGKGLFETMKEQAAAAQATAAANIRNTAATEASAAATTTLAVSTELAAAASISETAAETTETAALATNTVATTANTTATTAQAAATATATGATGFFVGALNILKVALISTGIGAIVIGLGLLVAAFASTERGSEALARVLTPLKFVFEGIWGFIQDLSFAMVDGVKSIGSFSNAFKMLGDFIIDQFVVRFQSFLNILQGGFNAIVSLAKGDLKQAGAELKNIGTEFVDMATGIDGSVGKLNKALKSASESMRDFNQKMKESFENGKKVVALEEELETINISKVTQLAKLNVEMQKNKNLATDQLATDEEKIQANKKVIALAKQIFDLNNATIAKEIQLAELRTKQSDTSDEEYQKIADLKAKQIALEGEYYADVKRNSTALSGIYKKQQDDEAKLQQQQQDRINLLQDIIIKDEEKARLEVENQIKTLGLDKELTKLTELELQVREKIYSDFYKEKRMIQEKEQLALIQGMLSEQEKATKSELLELEKRYYNELALLEGNEEAKKALTNKFNKDKLIETSEFISNQIQIIESELNQMQASTDMGIADSLLSEESKQELTSRLQELQTELAKVNYEANQVGIDTETGEKSLTEKLGLSSEEVEGLKATYTAAMNAVQGAISIANDNVKRNTDERIAKIDAALKQGVINEKQAEEQKKKVMAQSLEQQKKLQKASASVSYFQGLIQAVANAMQLGPIAGPIVGAINSAMLTATYLANLKNIDKQKYAEGGLIQGASHENGGVPFTVQGRAGFEAEGGEYIVKKSAVDAYGVNYLEALNSMKIPKMFAEGGMIPTPINNTASEVSKGIQPLADAVGNMQLEVIQVESKFTKMQNRVQNVERATTY